MIENLIIFEDDTVAEFEPMVHNRAVFELKAGMFSFLERLHLFFPKAMYSLCSRDYLSGVLSERYPKYFINSPSVGLKALIINGRVVFNKGLLELIESFESDTSIDNYLIVNQKTVVAVQLAGELLAQFMKAIKPESFKSEAIIMFLRKKLKVKTVSYEDIIVINDIASIIANNEQILRHDFSLMNNGGIVLGEVHNQAVLSNEKDIFIGKNTTVAPFVHIDASQGPVYVADNVQLKSQVLIEGPAFIDDNAIIYPGYIRKNTSIGENCRIGGEVEDTIFMANTNKYHAGFVGHSYVGEWVNFGALTTTSDLKNNYSPINLNFGEKTKNTSLLFLGSIIGDYTKFGIGTMLNTGSVVGFGSNLFGAFRVLDKWIPSFSWGSADSITEYSYEKFILTVEKVYERRKKSLPLSEKNLLQYVFKATARERV